VRRRAAGSDEKHRPESATSRPCSEVGTLAVHVHRARVFSRSTQDHCVWCSLWSRTALACTVESALPSSLLPCSCPNDPAPQTGTEMLDRSDISIYDAARLSTDWIARHIDLGWSIRIWWSEGFHLLPSITPTGRSPCSRFAPVRCSGHPWPGPVSLSRGICGRQRLCRCLSA
jgi:hypothetical protein